MKRIALILAVIIVLSMPLSVQAAQSRMISVLPEITVDGTTATCKVRAAADHMSEHLEATIKLYRGNILLATWYEDGYGYIDFTETKTVLSGHIYKLTVDLTVDGVAVPQVTATSRDFILN